MSIQKIIDIMEEIAPSKLALDWDNTGFLVGDSDANVEHVLVALDIDMRVIEEAINLGVQLIISHHPIIFKGIKHVNNQTHTGLFITRLIQNGIAAFAAHTNYDIVPRGINDSLFDILQLQDKQMLDITGSEHCLGRVGTVKEPVTLEEYSRFVANALNVDILRYVGDPNAIVKRVAVCGGASSEIQMFELALKKGADLYITGDIRYHEAQTAYFLGLNLIDATHYATEQVGMVALAKELKNRLSDSGVQVSLSKTNFQFFKGIKKD